MAYINLSSADRAARAGQINSSIGTSGFLNIYTGVQPLNPDLTASGTLIVQMPLSAVAAVASMTVQSATVVAGGSGGTNGTQTVTGTTGTGTKFTASATVSGGAITAVLSITTGGNYSVNPTNLNAEPVTGAGLTGATLALNVTGLLTFNSVTQTNATGPGTLTAGYARVTTSAGTGVIDLDVSATGGGGSLQLNTVSITNGGPVVVTLLAFTEA